MRKKMLVFIMLLASLLCCNCAFCKASTDENGSDEVISLKREVPLPSATAAGAAASPVTQAAAAETATVKVEAAATAEVVTKTAEPAGSTLPARKTVKTGVTTGAKAQETVSPEQQKINELVAKVKAKQAGRKSMKCDIVIKTSYGSAGTPQEVKGTVTIKKKDKFKVHYTSPTEQFMISNGKSLWVYTPGLKQVIKQAAKDAALDTNFYIEIENSIEYFVKNSKTTLAEDDRIYTLAMTPRDRKKLDFDEITVKIVKADLVPEYMSMKFEGSLMEVLFSNITNFSAEETLKAEDLADKNFNFKTPEGVEEINASDLIDAAGGK